MREFEAPARSLGDLDADVAGRLIAAAADVALIIDDKGVIRDLAFGSEELLREGYYDWLGKPWAETVTVESRPKVVGAAARLAAPTRRRAGATSTIPRPTARTCRCRTPRSPCRRPAARKSVGRAVVFGRDLRANAALQQRLVSAQQAMERDYWRLRHMETRYRSLFQVAAEAVLIVDAASGRLDEANPAAVALFGSDASRPGSVLAESFDGPGRDAVQSLLARVNVSGTAESRRPGSPRGAVELRVSASLFRQEKTTHLLVRVAPAEGAVAGAEAHAQQRLAQADPGRARCLRRHRPRRQRPQCQPRLRRAGAARHRIPGARPVARAAGSGEPGST